jgi:tetratricopeptide (TPR) repeat protein
MKILEINNKIESGNNAAPDFETYLRELAKEECSYQGETWSKDWIKAVYKFGTFFENHDAGKYLIVLKKVFNEENPENEKFAFIYSEIAWNYFGNNNEYIKDVLREFTKKYPYNPEFHHTYGHYLANNKTYDRAFDEYEWALTIQGASSDVTFLNSYLETLKGVVDFYLSKGQLETSSGFLSRSSDFLEKKGYLKDIPQISFRVRTILGTLADRIKDHEIFKNQMAFFEDQIENKISVAQKRLIEIIGIFSAIVAFILSNVSIFTNNLGVRESLILMLGMADVLLIFSISVSYLFGRRYRWTSKWYFIEQNKFWAVITLILLLIVLIVLTK